MTESSKKVSIIMNCRNSEKYLREAIDSVYAQTYPNWEIVFYDNLSTDSSPQIAQSYDSKIRYVRGERPLSLGEARNEALKHASGEFVTFLDCDDLWTPNKLERQIATFTKHPDAGFAHTAYLNFFDANGKLLRIGGTTEIYDPKQEMFRQQLLNYDIGIMTVMFRRELLNRLDVWFDPRLTLAEDVDFFVRLLLLAPACYDPEPTSKYRIHGNNLTQTLKQHWAEEFDLIQQKMNQIIPDFKTRFAAEDRSLRSRVAFFRARNSIIANDSRRARQLLTEFRFQSPKMFAYYAVSFFPASVWTTMYRLYFKIRYS